MLCGAWPSVPPPSVSPPALLMAPSASGTPAAAARPASVPSPQPAVSEGREQWGPDASLRSRIELEALRGG